MSAIAGAIGRDDAQPTRERCDAALAALSAYGRHASVRTVEGATFGIRHGSDEPLPVGRPVANSRFLLVADARLNNPRELRHTLGLTATPCTAAQILLAAWSTWGESTLDRIAGDFALAVYDLEDRTLTLARDPYGVRPLFYTLRDGQILFGSMPSALLTGKSIAFDLPALASRSQGAAGRDDQSYFEDVLRVLPGEIVALLPRSRRRTLYWQPRLDPFRNVGDNEFVDAFRSKLDIAVGDRLPQGSAAIASHLSSGYDSSAVTATAARLKAADARMIAFTSVPVAGLQLATPAGWLPDEGQIAAATAHSCGIEHVCVPDRKPLLESLRGHGRLYQEPVRNPFNHGWWSDVAVAAREAGASVLLSGEVGNYTISHGSLPVLREWLRQGRVLDWWREARAAAQRPDVRWRGVLFESAEPWLPRSLSGAMLRLVTGVGRQPAAGFINPDILATLRPPDAGPRLSGPQTRLQAIRRIDPGALLKGRLAHTGVEERDPTADRHLIEFTLRLPPEQLLRDGVYKPLARKALADRLPEAVLAAPRRGFQGAAWFARTSQRQALELLEDISASPAANALLNIADIRNAIDDWPRLGDRPVPALMHWGRNLTSALAVGLFVAEAERYPNELGR